MRDPCFAMLYGELKAGKTADALATFPAAIYVAAPGALSPAEGLWGFSQPEAHDLETFADVQRCGETCRGAPALVIDDASLIADRTVNYYKARYSGFDLWGSVFTSAIKMRDSLRRRGMHVVMTCHPAPAETKDGVRHKGGPAFPGQVRAKLPAAADLLLRAESIGGGPANGAPGPAGATGASLIITSGPPSLGWPMCYRTARHPDWLQGSRYHTPDRSPMNLREILRAAGFPVPRLPGLEWQDALADAIAGQLATVGLADGAKVRGVLAQARDYALTKLSREPRHVYWALRDGYDRALLRAACSVQQSELWKL